MGIRLAATMGNTVTAISTSPGKKKTAMKIGAKNFIVSKDEEQMKAAAGSLDLILNTVSANHQEWFTLTVRQYLELNLFSHVCSCPHTFPCWHSRGGLCKLGLPLSRTW